MSILIVDDTSIMRIVLRRILTELCGYTNEQVLEASDGGKAISAYKTHRPELVLLDIEMPDKNGAVVVKEIIKFDPEANIIMCTASNDREDVLECMRAGAKDYIIKPPDPKRVRKAVFNITGGEIPYDEEDEDDEE